MVVFAPFWGEGVVLGPETISSFLYNFSRHIICYLYINRLRRTVLPLFTAKGGILTFFTVLEVLTGIFGKKALIYQNHSEILLFRLFYLLNFMWSKKFCASNRFSSRWISIVKTSEWSEYNINNWYNISNKRNINHVHLKFLLTKMGWIYKNFYFTWNLVNKIA